MNIFKIIIPGLFVFALTANNAQAENFIKEEAIESVSLKIALDKETGIGIVYGKICDQCKKLKLNITPQTLAYEGETQVALSKAKSRLGKYATVIFNEKTLDVIRIVW